VTYLTEYKQFYGSGPMGENTITDIMRYMNSDPSRPLKEGEFKEFWQSLTEEEKDSYRKMELK
jgi:hypothetical protein